ncbi:kynurenine formamidase isoform X2 [Haemorhous mexicanus]|uniref:kynurenine formamidase isoform X2 n=1 Tax=Haemorhous mexicanus TaxID=30427 RepID=UPI0028BD8C89|nr:kynurenine formamidase isoform X2 [Haemorhous mexicanus]
MGDGPAPGLWPRLHGLVPALGSGLASGTANGSVPTPPPLRLRPSAGRQPGNGNGIGIGTGSGPTMGGWRDMSAEELEDHYSPSRWSPRLDRDTIIDAHLAVTAAGTERARASGQTLLHVPYGDGDGEKLDIYFPTDPSETFPALVYIHGGYWQCLSKDDSGFAAPPLVSQGVAVVAVGYDIAPKGRCCPAEAAAACAAQRPPALPFVLCSGHMDTMVLQVRRSLVFLVEHYPRIRQRLTDRETSEPTHSDCATSSARSKACLGVRRCPSQSLPPSRGIYLCGHSAGAHLAAMVLSTDWTEFQVVPDIKGVVLVSGLYDLEPILHTYVNDALNMSWEVAQRNSPMRHVTPAVPAACEVLMAVAQHDSPEFRRQSQEYSQALRAAGWSVSVLDLAGVDHFDVIERLSEDSYVLTQVILNMISRAR